MRPVATLLPALRYHDQLYTAPPHGQHLDALPKHLADDFHQKAMSGEDISNFSFGFINDKGEFLNREHALKYAIDQGLLHPSDAQYVTLTSTMLDESAQRRKAIKDVAKSDPEEIERLVRNVGG